MQTKWIGPSIQNGNGIYWNSKLGEKLFFTAAAAADAGKNRGQMQIGLKWWKCKQSSNARCANKQELTALTNSKEKEREREAAIFIGQKEEFVCWHFSFESIPSLPMLQMYPVYGSEDAFEIFNAL